MSPPSAGPAAIWFSLEPSNHPRDRGSACSAVTLGRRGRRGAEGGRCGVDQVATALTVVGRSPSSSGELGVGHADGDAGQHVPCCRAVRIAVAGTPKAAAGRPRPASLSTDRARSGECPSAASCSLCFQGATDVRVMWIGREQHDCGGRSRPADGRDGIDDVRARPPYVEQHHVGPIPANLALGLHQRRRSAQERQAGRVEHAGDALRDDRVIVHDVDAGHYEGMRARTVNPRLPSTMWVSVPPRRAIRSSASQRPTPWMTRSGAGPSLRRRPRPGVRGRDGDRHAPGPGVALDVGQCHPHEVSQCLHFGRRRGPGRCR